MHLQPGKIDTKTNRDKTANVHGKIGRSSTTVSTYSNVLTGFRCRAPCDRMHEVCSAVKPLERDCMCSTRIGMRIVYTVVH